MRTSTDPTAEQHARFVRLHDADVGAALAEAAAARAEARATGRRVVVISACLLGERVRPNGGHKHAPDVVGPLLADPGVLVLPLCPEILARMGIPRPTVAFAQGDGEAVVDGRPARIVDSEGVDRTAAMLEGARLAERLAEVAGAASALLKEKSPSCGARSIHGPDGLGPGSGVFAALLRRRGLPLRTEDEPG